MGSGVTRQLSVRELAAGDMVFEEDILLKKEITVFKVGDSFVSASGATVSAPTFSAPPTQATLQSETKKVLEKVETALSSDDVSVIFSSLQALTGSTLSLTPAQQNSYKNTLTLVESNDSIAAAVTAKFSEVKTAVTTQKSVTITSDVKVQEVTEVVMITAAPTGTTPSATTASETTTTAPDTTAAPDATTASASRVLGLGGSL